MILKKYVYIAAGGFLGAISRFFAKGITIYHYEQQLPLNTLIINVSGSFALALLLTMALEVYEFDADLRLGISTGFLGAFTTFSTMCKEIVTLMAGGDYYSAVSYILASVMLGLAAAYLGALLARGAVSKLNEGNN